MMVMFNYYNISKQESCQKEKFLFFQLVRVFTNV